jgi:SIR2-like domain
MTAAEFFRAFPLRAANLVWLLGAGASAASGIPTAGYMIWDFKRRLYCAEQGISLRSCEDLTDPKLRSKIQRFLDGRGDCPLADSEEEYSHYFSMTFPDEADRRRYIEQMISKATPSFGFLALAVLMKLGKTRGFWTTNFDRNIEDAAAVVLNTTGKLIVATLDTPHLMREAMQEGRGPVLGKLHGDFQSRRLKNTSAELQAQDSQLRHELVEACKRTGLIVTGYSGRDRSVMDALEEAIDCGRGYPAGLFWFTRGEQFSRVTSLIEKTQTAGIDAHLIEMQTFDELLADIIAQFPDLPDEDAKFLHNKGKRVSDVPIPQKQGGWPVIRLNAIEIVKFPNVCRLVKCDIGGVKEVLVAINETGAQLVATRRKVGVLLFGSDAEVQKAFASHNITTMDLHTIESRRLWYESAEAGLIYDALVMALARERDLIPEQRRGHHIVRIDQSSAQPKTYEPLKRALNGIFGTIPGTNVTWTEAIEIHLAYRLTRLWLVIEPKVWVTQPLATEKDIVEEFQRERQATRYNRQWNDLLGAWVDIISRNQPVAKITTFGIEDGVDAAFEIANTTAFSRCLKP